MKKLLFVLLFAIGVHGSTLFKEDSNLTVYSSIDTFRLYYDVGYDSLAVGKRPLAVVIPGYGNDKSSVDTGWVHRMVSHGYVVLSMDSRGRGKCAGTSWKDAQGAESYDYYDCIKACLSNYNSIIDTTKIYGVGYSNGGGALIAMAVRFPDLFNFIVDNFGMNHWASHYDSASASNKTILANDLFGATPSTKPNMYKTRDFLQSINNNRFVKYYIYHDTVDSQVRVVQSRNWVRKLDSLGLANNYLYYETNPSNAVRAHHTNGVNGYQITYFEYSQYPPCWVCSLGVKTNPTVLPDSAKNWIVNGYLRTKKYQIILGNNLNFYPVYDTFTIGNTHAVGMNYNLQSRYFKLRDNVTAIGVNRVQFNVYNVNGSYRITKTDSVTGSAKSYYAKTSNGTLEWTDTLGVGQTATWVYRPVTSTNIVQHISGVQKWCALTVDSAFVADNQTNYNALIDMQSLPSELWAIGTTAAKWGVFNPATGAEINRYIEQFDAISKKGLIWITLDLTKTTKVQIEVSSTFNKVNSASVFIGNNQKMSYSFDEAGGSIADRTGIHNMDLISGTPVYSQNNIKIPFRDRQTPLADGVRLETSTTHQYFRDNEAEATLLGAQKAALNYVFKFNPASFTSTNFRNAFVGEFNGTRWSMLAYTIKDTFFVSSTSDAKSSARKVPGLASVATLPHGYMLLTAVFDGTKPETERMTFYINGVKKSSSLVAGYTEFSSTLTSNGGTTRSYIGGAAANGSLYGTINELRLQTGVAPDSNYVATQYANLFYPEKFWGVSETYSAVGDDDDSVLSSAYRGGNKPTFRGGTFRGRSFR